MGNNSWTHPPFFWRHMVPQNVGNIICVCYFLNIVFDIFSIFLEIQISALLRKINSGTTTPGTASKSSCHNFGKNHKLLKLYEKRPTCFQTLTFGRNLGFQKSWICPWIFQGFPTPWISHPLDFGFSGRPRERPTKTKIGRQGRISRLPEGSRVNIDITKWIYIYIYISHK